jgi:tetratricopeptide (TPR) repeat protein
MAKANPQPSLWPLTTIAMAQAKSGDRDGAIATFFVAEKQAAGEFGGEASSWNLWRVGHFEAECGLKAEALVTLKRAVSALRRAAGDFQTDRGVVDALAEIVQDLAAIGARDDARATIDELLTFSEKFLASTRIRNELARDQVAPAIASALAAVGDFEAAFRWADQPPMRSSALGQIAVAAARCLERESACKFVHQAAARLAKLEWADEPYFGLIDLAAAQARLGEIEAAKETAKAIGAGKMRGGVDMTDGQPAALIRVAAILRDAGDIAGAKVALRHALRSLHDHPDMRGRDGQYHQLAAAQLAIGEVDGAVRAIDAIGGRRSEILTTLAMAQAAARDETAARATLARALREAGIPVSVRNLPQPEPGKSPRSSRTMSVDDRSLLAEIQAMRGDVPGALETLRSIDDDLDEPSALKRIVSARAAAGDVSAALEIAIHESKTRAERRFALEGLAEGVDSRLSLETLKTPKAQGH